MNIIHRLLVGILWVACVQPALADGIEGNQKSQVTGYCDAWVGIIRLAKPEEKFHTLVKETKTIPMVLPDEDPYYQWGFALACDNPDKSCMVKYSVYAPVENNARITESEPILERLIRTPRGGVVRPFGFDPGDKFGIYRLVVDVEGRRVCDTEVEIVE